MILKHSYPLAAESNGFRSWQFIFDTPNGELRVTRDIPVSRDEWEQSAWVRAALADVLNEGRVFAAVNATRPSLQISR